MYTSIYFYLIIFSAVTWAQRCSDAKLCDECIKAEDWLWGSCVWCPSRNDPAVGSCMPKGPSSDFLCPGNVRTCSFGAPSSSTPSVYNPPPSTTSPAPSPSLSCSNSTTRTEFVETRCTPQPQSCEWYLDCLESCHPCGAYGYALGYGSKYCNAYMDYNLSPKAGLWRDSVLLCLQHALKPTLLEDLACDEIRDRAFDSHPACYTQPSNSVCDLDVWPDWRDILVITYQDSIFSWAGITQSWDVMKTCGTKFLKAMIFTLKDFLATPTTYNYTFGEENVYFVPAANLINKRDTSAEVVLRFIVNPNGIFTTEEVQETLVALAMNGTLFGAPAVQISECSDSNCDSRTTIYEATSPSTSISASLYCWTSTILYCFVSIFL